MVKEAEEAGPTGMPLFEIPASRTADPAAYVEAVSAVLAALGRREISSTDAKRQVDVLRDLCLDMTGQELAQIAREYRDPIDRFASLMECDEKELAVLEQAVARVDSVKAPEDIKKKWIGLIHRVGAIQAACRTDPAKMMVYVMRSDDAEEGQSSSRASNQAVSSQYGGALLQLEWFHVKFFRIWRQERRNSLVEAPVGHGKSACLRSLIAFEIAEQPSMRGCYVTDDQDKASRTIRAVRRMLRSPRYRALYPHIHIQGREGDVECNADRFTVAGASSFSRDPTLEAVGIMSAVQGNRYDHLYGDDPSPPEVAYHQQTRQRVNERWVGVFEGRIANPAKSRIRVICTPWAVDDLAGMIEGDYLKGLLAGWTVHIDEFRIKDGPDGKAIPLWPSRYGVDFLQERKVRDGRAYDYKYRLLAATRSSVTVRRVMYYNRERAGPLATANDIALLDAIGQAERWLTIDPSGGKGGQHASDTGVVETVITPGGRAFVAGCWAFRGTLVANIEQIRELILQCPPPGYHGLHWEAAGGVGVGIPGNVLELKRQLRERGYDADRLEIVFTNANISGVGRAASKTQRLQACAGMIENGLVRFPADVQYELSEDKKAYRRYQVQRGSQVEHLIDSLLHWDGVTGTDCVDALTQWLLKHRERLNAFAPAWNPTEPWRQAPKPQGQMGGLHRESIDRILERILSPETDGEDEFLAGMSQRSVA